MSVQVQLRRDTLANIKTAVYGAQGELWVADDTQEVYLQSGNSLQTPGGYKVGGAFGAYGSLLQTGLIESAGAGGETITPGGTTYTSTVQLPAGYKWILGAGWRVETTLAGPTGNLSLGVTGNATAFINAQPVSGFSLTAGSTTLYGQNGLRYDASPISLLLTSSAGNFTAGALRFVVHYLLLSPPTS